MKAKKSKIRKANRTRLKMASLKQKAVLDEMVVNGGDKKSIREAVVAKGYSESYAKSGKITQTKTWQGLMEKYLPDEELAQVHQEGLRAVNSKGRPEYFARHKYLESAYKLKKRYDESITIKGKFGSLSDAEIEGRVAGIVSGVIGALTGAGKKKAD